MNRFLVGLLLLSSAPSFAVDTAYVCNSKHLSEGALLFVNGKLSDATEATITVFDASKTVTDTLAAHKISSGTSGTTLTFNPSIEIDWTKEKDCYVSRTRIELSELVDDKGDVTGKASRAIDIVVDPAKPSCSFPRVRPAPPEKVACAPAELAELIP